MAKRPKNDDSQVETTFADAAPGPTEGELEGKRQQRSKREWIDPATGEKVNADEGTAVRYTYLDDGRSVTYDLSHITDFVDQKILGFGMLTWMGNEVNTWLHSNSDREASPIDRIESELARMRETKQWNAKAEGGTGARVNKDALARAVFEVMTENGRTTFKDGKRADDLAELRQRLEEDEKGMLAREWRSIGPFQERYTKLAGKPVKSLDDV